MKKTYILQMPDKAGVFLKANNSVYVQPISKNNLMDTC